MTKKSPPRPPSATWEEKVKPEHHQIFWECLADEEFTSAPSFRDQCFYIFSRSPQLTDCDIAPFFDVDHHSITFQRSRFATPAKRPGRPSILNDDQCQAVIDYITDRLAHSEAPTCNDVLNFIYDDLGVDILPDTFRHWINRRTDFKTAMAPPMEKKRVEVGIDAIMRYFEALQEAVDGVPAALVLNLDESGFQRFADAANETVIVSKGCQRPVHAVPRDEKRATFLAAITASGRYLRPLMILPRLTIEAELFACGYSEDVVALASSSCGFITKNLFERYCAEVLVPYVRRTREKTDYNGRAVLIMDGCSCHRSAFLDELFDDNGIVVVFLPAHSSDQVQALDVGIFGNHKSAQSRIHVPKEMSKQTQQVVRAVSAFQAIAHPYAVTSAFKKAGITPVLREGLLFVEVTPWTASRVRDLPETYLSAPDGFQAYNKARIEIASQPFQTSDLVGGHEGSYGRIEDLPYVPDTLDPTYESSLMRDFADLALGDLDDLALSDDSDDADFIPEPEEPARSACRVNQGQQNNARIANAQPVCWPTQPIFFPPFPGWFPPQLNR